MSVWDYPAVAVGKLCCTCISLAGCGCLWLSCRVQVLKGDIREAVCSHALFYTLWRRFGALPERFDFHSMTPNVPFYPLRPELVESTYMLYQVGLECCHAWSNYSTRLSSRSSWFSIFCQFLSGPSEHPSVLPFNFNKLVPQVLFWVLMAWLVVFLSCLV